jgi:hypothetical protein
VRGRNDSVATTAAQATAAPAAMVLAWPLPAAAIAHPSAAGVTQRRTVSPTGCGTRVASSTTAQAAHDPAEAVTRTACEW